MNPKVCVVVELFDNCESCTEDRIIQHRNIAVCGNPEIAEKLIDKLVYEKVKFAYDNKGIPVSGVEDGDIHYVRIKWSSDTPREMKGLCYDYGEWEYGIEQYNIVEEA